ncbi:MAG TPA: aspartate/glutamate racemase family protein [Roseiarcus sp.]|nr:aspartate/glutamate racemase family protein [Roseiarcus sp.]
MRRLLIINPNTTEAMTQRIAAQARRFAAPDMRIETRTAAFGHSVIASRAAYAIAAHAALEAYARAGGGFDAVILACFGDPGLEALREVASEPVFGLAEASIRDADGYGEPFAILTLGRAWIGMLEERVLLARVGAPFLGVFAGEGTGLDAAHDAGAVVARLQGLADAAVRAGAGALILGGAALAGLTAELRCEARLVDCVEATMRAVAGALASQAGSVAPPGSTCLAPPSE